MFNSYTQVTDKDGSMPTFKLHKQMLNTYFHIKIETFFLSKNSTNDFNHHTQ